MATTIMVGIMEIMACIDRTQPSTLTRIATPTTLGILGPSQDSTLIPTSSGGPHPTATLATMQTPGSLKGK